MITDAGGSPAADGRRVRRERLFRVSGDLVGDADLASIDVAALRAVIDMRGGREDRSALVAWAAEQDIAYHHRPIDLLGAGDLARRIRDASSEQAALDEMGSMYRLVLDEHGDAVAGAIGVLAEGTPAAFGCAAGKDRTGILSAVLLTALGVAREDVVAAYVALAPPRERLLARLRETPWLAGADADAPGVQVMLGASAPTMHATLDHLERAHGGAVAYLSERGVGPAQLEALRADLLEPA